MLAPVGDALAQAPSQPLYATGDGEYDDSLVRSLPVAPITRAFLPEAVSLKDRFPVPGDQKDVGSCVAWAVGYAARSYYEIASGQATRDDANRIVSPSSLHARLLALKGGTCKAPNVNILDGMRALQSKGAQSLARHPNSSLESFCRGDTSSGAFRIKDALLVAQPEPRFGTGKMRSGLGRDALDRIRVKLAAGDPVVISMLVGKSFMRLQAGDRYAGSIHRRPGDLGDDGMGHAMVIVGYDDRKRAFQLMNSWGTGWADGGFAWVDYDTMLSDGRLGISMVADTTAPPPPPIGVEQPLEGLDAADLACGQVEVAGGATVKGFVATHAAKERVEQLARAKGLQSEVALRPWPICETLKTLKAPLAAPHRPKLKLIGGERPLNVGEYFALEVTPPDVPAYLYVVYIEDDGTVVNLLPRRGVVRQQLDIGSPPLVFGDGQNGRPRFKVTPLRATDNAGRTRTAGDPERGHEAVIAIAARAPIEELEDGSEVYGKPKDGAKDGTPADRLLLSRLRDITLRVAPEATVARQVTADVLHLKIAD
ncbi:MAG: C1 family peptidase [Hyphomicrobiaceae bacterium]|nr:C1 family peptidase [Hyphomicrobiaceae bacterium]